MPGPKKDTRQVVRKRDWRTSPFVGLDEAITQADLMSRCEDLLISLG